MSYNVGQESAAARRRKTRRALWGAAAVGSTALAWLAGRLARVDYIVITPMGTRHITLGLVIPATTIAGLIGWAVYGLLERYTSRASPLWIAVTLTVLATSIAPIYLLPASTQTRLALTALHCLAAAILIPGLPQPR